MPLFTFFFFNDTATTEIYTLSLHDALPIWSLDAPLQDFEVSYRPVELRSHLDALASQSQPRMVRDVQWTGGDERLHFEDRKSTRLNSSHANISYAVFCLKKKNKLSSHSHTL